MKQQNDKRRTPTNGNGYVQSEFIFDTPAEVLESIDMQAEEAGGEWQLSSEHEGCIGWTMFDTPTSDDGTVTVLLPKDNIEATPRQSLVRIKSVIDDRIYLGAVVKGPFAEPDGLKADAPVIVTTTIKGGLFMPKYHGRIYVEIVGEELQDGSVVPPRRRPLPNSPTFILDSHETARVLRIGGEIKLGMADGHEDIEVRIPKSKSVLPRHLGILGTTGGGKSTTVSGLIAQFQKADIATIILDTEGEYTAISNPTEDDGMKRALERRGLKPEGVKNTHIYRLVGRETTNPKHRNLHQFSLRFSELSPYAVMEILELTEAQQTRFLKAYDTTKLVLERLNIYPANDEEKNQLLELDELETGYPRMSLTHLYDIVKMIASGVAKEKTDPFVETQKFFQNKEELKKTLKESEIPSNVASWRALQGKLGRIKRLGIFDSADADPISYRELLKPGCVSIIDLNDTESPQVNNMVIAQMLKGIQQQQEENYRVATANKTSPTPTMVLIEEAHEFLSAERVKQMPVLFQQVARIAKRGRKRWLGLVFITQLPQHLPNEVLGLINNWILHKINDDDVVKRLRRSIGGIDSGLWSQLPSLAPGQSVVSFTSLSRPLLVAIDPTPCQLLMVD